MQSSNKILAVDDNPLNNVIIERMLGDRYELRVATSGEEALEVVQGFRPDLTLLDIMMPGINGYEVCRRFRDNPALRTSKIIMISAKAMLSERLEGYAAGADDYLTKPFEQDELLAKVRVYMRLKSVEEVEPTAYESSSPIGHEIAAKLNGILLPATILLSDDELEVVDRKMLASIVHRNGKDLHRILCQEACVSAVEPGKDPEELAETINEETLDDQ